MATTRTAADTVVLLQQAAGIALIPKPTALTRLNYFDGKFLRAADLQDEQEYHRRLQQLATSAGGSGVVHGFDLQALAGDQLELGAGLALDAEGRVLYMPMDAAVQIEELIRRSSGASVVLAGGAKGSAQFTLCESAAVTPAVTPVVAGTSLYVVGITHAEALCGQEDVFGKPCESACASGTERPQRLEGVVLRALPLQLASPLPASQAEPVAGALHLRSRVASAWFADEARQIESLISGSGLLSSLWCRGAAPAAGQFVPLAVLGRAGGRTVFMDAWTARRERMDSAPRRYWQWRMAMRPQDVFMAQVLQFQCQFRDAWVSTPGADDDPCADLRKAVVEVGDILTQLDRQYQLTAERLALRDAAALKADPVPVSRTLLASAVKRAAGVRRPLVLQPSERALIRRGIVELPAAGWLPVAPGSAFPVNEQVRRLMGEGVDLRICVVRPDYVAHALEEAQHMQRISLLRGLDNPQQKEEVDILVPDGQILDAASNQGAGWEVRLANATKADAALSTRLQRNVMTGAARSEQQADGALSFFFAGLLETASRDAALVELKAWAGERANSLEQTLWKSVELYRAAAVAAFAPAPAAPVAAAAAPQAAAARKSRAKATATTPAPAPEPTPQELASRMSALREQSVAYRQQTLERVGKTASTAGISHFGGLSTTTGGKDSDHTALWLALRSEADPLAAAEGSRIDVSLELSILSPQRGGSQYVDIGIVGAQLVVEARVTSGQRVVVQGTLRGAAIIAGLVGTLANAQRGLQFSVPVIISSEPTDAGRATRVEVDFSGLLFDNRGFLGLERLGVQVLTAEQNRRAELRIALTAEGVDLDMAARLVRNDAVLGLGHPLRAASEAAIDVIATRESAANFASQARADLFGQRAPQQDALSVRATLDWVLFHRRRNKQCGAAPSAPALEARRYELHHLKVASEEQVRAARAAVIAANANAIRKLGFAPVGAVAFDGGRSSIATPTAALLQDWQAAAPGTRMRFGGIGSQGAAQSEGDALAMARLAGLELTLAQGTLDRALENQVLPVLPALGLAGWDGAVFIITQDVQVVCHDLMTLPDDKTALAFATLVRRSGLAAAVAEFKMSSIAHLVFNEDGKTLNSASVGELLKAWGEGSTPPKPALVFHGSTTTTALATARSEAIVKLLGGGAGTSVAAVVRDLDKVSNCAGVSVLVRSTVSQPVSRFPATALLVLSAGGVFPDDVPISALTFIDGNPVDPEALASGVKGQLERSPFQLKLAMPPAVSVAQANRLAAALMAEVRKSGGTGIVSPAATIEVLSEPEIERLASRGHAPGSYAMVAFFVQHV